MRPSLEVKDSRDIEDGYDNSCNYISSKNGLGLTWSVPAAFVA